MNVWFELTDLSGYKMLCASQWIERVSQDPDILAQYRRPTVRAVVYFSSGAVGVQESYKEISDRCTGRIT